MSVSFFLTCEQGILQLNQHGGSLHPFHPYLRSVEHEILQVRRASRAGANREGPILVTVSLHKPTHKKGSKQHKGLTTTNSNAKHGHTHDVKPAIIPPITVHSI